MLIVQSELLVLILATLKLVYQFVEFDSAIAILIQEFLPQEQIEFVCEIYF